MERTSLGLLALLMLGAALASSVAAQSSSCEGAAFLPPPYLEKVVGGTTARKAGSNDGCSGGVPADTYKITPSSGNRVTIKACGPLTADPYLVVTVFTGGCSVPNCLAYARLPAMTDCVHDSERVEFVADEAVYWIVVETDSGAGGQYSISINEGIVQTPLPGCEDAITVPGPYSPPVSFFSSVGPSSYDDSDDDTEWATVFVIDSFDYGSAEIHLSATHDSDIPMERETSGPGGSWDVRLVGGAIQGGVAGAALDVVIDQGSWTTVCNNLAYCSAAVAYEDYSSSIDVFLGSAAGWRITYTSSGGGEIGVSVIDTSGKQDYFVVQLETCVNCETVITFSELSAGVDLTDLVVLSVGVIGSDINVEVTELAVVAMQMQRSSQLVTGATLPCSGAAVTTQLAWFKIFPSVGEVTVSTCTGGMSPTNIDVYGGRCGDLVCIPHVYSAACATGMSVTFNAYNPMYYVVVSGRNGATGTFELLVEEERFSFASSSTWDLPSAWSPSIWTPASPVSWFAPSAIRSPWPESTYDSGEYTSCDYPIPVSYGTSSTEYNNGYSYSNLCGLHTSSGSAWFSFIPTWNDRVTIDTCQCNFDTVLAVVSDCSSLTCLASNDDHCNNWGSAVTLDVTVGREYIIFVAGYGSNHGSFVLRIESGGSSSSSEW